jgi:hypothetical protein
MKTLRNILGIEESKKSINNFSGNLDFNSMFTIKGGQDDDLWPPKIPVTTPPPPKN